MTEPVKLNTAALCELFEFGSDNTDLQREEAVEEMLGAVVEWAVEVYEVQKSNDSTFRVLTNHCAGPSRAPRVEARLFVSTAEDHALVRKLKTGSVVQIRGRIAGVDGLRFIELDPSAIATGTTLRLARRTEPAQAQTAVPKVSARQAEVEDVETWEPASPIISSGPLCQAILVGGRGPELDSIFADIPGEYFAGGEVYFHRDIDWIPTHMCQRAVSEYREDLDFRVDEGMVDARLIKALTIRLGVSYEPPERTERGRFMEQVHAFTDRTTSFAGHASEIRNVIRANPGGDCERLVRRAMAGDSVLVRQFADEAGPPPRCRDPNP